MCTSPEIKKIQYSKSYFDILFNAFVTAGDRFTLKIFWKDIALKDSFKFLIQRIRHQDKHYSLYLTARGTSLAPHLPEQVCSMGCPVFHALILLSISVYLLDSPKIHRDFTGLQTEYQDIFKIMVHSITRLWAQACVCNLSLSIWHSASIYSANAISRFFWILPYDQILLGWIIRYIGDKKAS